MVPALHLDERAPTSSSPDETYRLEMLRLKSLTSEVAHLRR